VLADPSFMCAMTDFLYAPWLKEWWLIPVPPTHPYIPSTMHMWHDSLTCVLTPSLHTCHDSFICFETHSHVTCAQHDPRCDGPTRVMSCLIHIYHDSSVYIMTRRRSYVLCLTEWWQMSAVPRWYLQHLPQSAAALPPVLVFSCCFYFCC